MKRCWKLFSQDKKTRARQYCTLAAVVCGGVALLAALWLVGPPLLRLFDQPEKFRAWVEGKGIWGQLAFVGMVVVQIIIAMIPGEPLEIAAGYAFGAVEGTILCVLGTAIGSILVFWFVRLVGMRAVEVFFPRSQIERLPFFRQPEKLELLAFILFFIPGTPKDLMTWAIGLTPMRFSRWMFIAMVARLPSVLTSTVGGSALGSQNYWFAAGVFLFTGLISGAGILLYRRLERQKSSG